MRYLLAAEADRIQDLLFRSSQLREVAGGSQMLKRFCDDVPSLLGRALGVPLEVITAGGGGFFLSFADPAHAQQFGPALAEAYSRATGGTLSYAAQAEPYESDADYGAASQRAAARLQAAKHAGRRIALPQTPYVAFCESCGVGLAEAHTAVWDEVEDPHYVCGACRQKANEGRGLLDSLRSFYQKILGSTDLKGWDIAHSADDIARHDSRRYVAYIVADGNGMGGVFRQCSKAQATALSKRLEEAIQDAVVSPLRVLMKNEDAAEQTGLLPVLPLIMGGDDLFALVPAPWALDIAGRLCNAFGEAMTSFVEEQGLPIAVTMTAAVVVCKANYPYLLAHEIGEARLSEAKRVVKALADALKLPVGAVDFEVVLGSQLAPDSTARSYRSTLRPYFLTDSPDIRKWGLPLSTLLEARWELAHLPAGRRSELRELFDQANTVTTPNEGAWNGKLDALVDRVKQVDPSTAGSDQAREPSRLEKQLTKLGGVHLEDWPRLARTHRAERWAGHGLGDLLRVWDWALRVDMPRRLYEGGGE